MKISLTGILVLAALVVGFVVIFRKLICKCPQG